MRLIAPTAFKGTFSPLEAARRLAAPGDRLFPLSDGGDGFLECLQWTLGGCLHFLEASDPFGKMRPVPVLELQEGTVALECAKVIGLADLLDPDPMKASSRGLGELIRRFQDAPRLWIGLGGSATVDGGMGWPDVSLPPTTVFCDVRTDLLDAVRIFGPQKGAKPEDLPLLEARLAAQGLPSGPGTGAAGGLGAKLISLGAMLVEGGPAMLDLLGFDEACHGCTAVITGEGRLDASTLEGKLPATVAKRARSLGIPVIGHFGSLGIGWQAARDLFVEIREGLAMTSGEA